MRTWFLVTLALGLARTAIADPLVCSEGPLAIDTSGPTLECGAASFSGSAETQTYAHWDGSEVSLDVAVFSFSSVNVSDVAVSLQGHRALRIVSEGALSLGAVLDASGLANGSAVLGGYAGGASGAGVGPGAGGEGAGDACAGASGASHGGQGAGFGSDTSGIADWLGVYGSRALAPLTTGSGGCGASSEAPGGGGGGAISLEAAGDLYIAPTGAVVADGGAALWPNASSAGSGGAVRLVGDAVVNDGLVSVAGNGGGGGGRVAIVYGRALSAGDVVLADSACEADCGGAGVYMAGNASWASCADVDASRPTGFAALQGGEQVGYCYMDADVDGGGGWTLLYANAAGDLHDERSFATWLDAQTGVGFQGLGFADAEAVGMFNLSALMPDAASLLLQDVGNRPSDTYHMLSFASADSLRKFLAQELVPQDNSCHELPDGEVFVVRVVDAGAVVDEFSYNQLRDFSGQGYGWGDCDGLRDDQSADASAVVSHPRHFLTSTASKSDRSRAKGIAGANGGSLTAVARLFVRAHSGPPDRAPAALAFEDEDADSPVALKGTIEVTPGADAALAGTYFTVYWADANGTVCGDCGVVAEADARLAADATTVPIAVPTSSIPDGQEQLFVVARNLYAQDAAGVAISVAPPAAPGATPEQVGSTGGSIALQTALPTGAELADVGLLDVELDGSAIATFDDMAALAADNLTATVYGLDYDTSYSVRVRWGTVVAGYGPWSPAVAAATGDLSSPGAPFDVALDDATGGALTVSWEPPLDTGGGELTGYNVFLDGELAYGGVGSLETAATVR